MRTRQPAPTITPQILLRAYAIGLFPMAEGADDPSLFWLDPQERGIFPLDGLVLTGSLRKVVRSDRFLVTVDTNFDAVIAACAAATPDRPQTWISARIATLYRELFDLGFAHSVEAYAHGELVGGLYGVSLGGAFFGESMFHRRTDASKVCLVHLVARLRAGGFSLLDTQFVTPHLASLGAVEVARSAYHAQLASALRREADFLVWGNEPVAGSVALQAIGKANRPASMSCSDAGP